MAAIVIVLVLMAGAGFAGFVAGAAWSGLESFESIAEGVAEDFADDMAGDGFSVDTGTPPADGETLRVGASVTGTMSGTPVAHPLTLETAGEVTIELRSDDFDTVVAVLDEDGSVLAENDDIEFGEDRNSRVEVSLSVGTYTVVVDAFGSGDGDYELSATS